MALIPVRIPQLQQNIPVVDAEGRMTNEFARRLNEILGSLANAVNGVIDAQNAAAQARMAAETAQAAAETAQQAAEQAQQQGGEQNREQALVSSGIMPRIVVRASATGNVSIATHTRYYGDGTTVEVDAGGVDDGYMPGDQVFVSYVDASRTGGLVIYEGSLSFQSQTNDRHVVGSVVVPDTGTRAGEAGPPPPGGA